VPEEAWLTPWDSILEFRRDPENRARASALRAWVREIARSGVSKREAEPKLEHLMHQYQRAMDIYEIKYSHGILETVVPTTAECLENLVKIRRGKVARSLFTLGKRSPGENVDHGQSAARDGRREGWALRRCACS